MSNRFLGILIIIGFIGAGYLYYNLSYLPEKQKEQNQISINNVIEEKKDPELVKQVINKSELTSSEKIEDIKENIKSYKTFNLDNNSKSYFIESENTLNLYLDSKKIGNFNLVYPEYLRVDYINGSENDLYIEVGADKFYYNDKTNNISKIELNIDINYIKTGSNNKLIFVTSKGSFIYSIFSNSFEYFSYFNDFVYFNEGYIGLVKKDDKRILTNLGFESQDKNLIVYYNPDTKEKKIIYTTDLDIKKIYVYNNKVHLVTDDEVFVLENI